jgi:single-stranded-DNA-specific exonuclease
MENAHEGITGIVAGKMKEYSGKPVAIVTPKEGTLKGTARGIDTIDIYEILGQDKELYEKFGGHKSACGFTIGEDNISRLAELVENTMGKLPEELLKPPVKYDMELDQEDVTLQLAKEIEMLQPFGCDNEKPVFRLSNAQIIDMRAIGKEGNHIKFKTYGGNNKLFDCIFFNCSRKDYMKISSADSVDIIGYLDINKWKGREMLQFIITSLI